MPSSTRRTVPAEPSASAPGSSAAARSTMRRTCSAGGVVVPWPTALPMSSRWIQVSNARCTSASRSGRSGGGPVWARRTRWSSPPSRPARPSTITRLCARHAACTSAPGPAGSGTTVRPRSAASIASLPARWATTPPTVSWRGSDRPQSSARTAPSSRSSRAACPAYAPRRVRISAAGRAAWAVASTRWRSAGGAGTTRSAASQLAAERRRRACAAQVAQPLRCASTRAASSWSQASRAHAPIRSSTSS
nr:hypothetical protein [Phytohabitans suffuscus]